MWFWIIFGLLLFFGFMVFTGAPYVPSKPREVRSALTELFQLGPKDTLVDIGSGDGLVLRIASSYGARAVGYEIHPVLVLIAKFLSRHDNRVVVHLANFWKVQIPDTTTVVYVFGDARDITKMYKKIEREATRIGHSIKFVTYGFEIPGVAPERTLRAHHLYTIKPLQSSDLQV